MTNTKKCRSVAFALCCLNLTGCVAAAAPLAMAAGAAQVGYLGFLGYKVYQTETSGEVQLAFEDEAPTPADVAEMSDFRRPGIWPTPGNLGAVTLAETLEGISPYEPVSPNQLQESLSLSENDLDLRQLTTSERTSLFNEICSKTPADSVIAYIDMGLSGEARFFSLSRPSLTRDVEIFYHACDERSIVFSEKISIVQEMGSTTVSDQETGRVAGEVLALRFDDLVKGRLDVEVAEEAE